MNKSPLGEWGEAEHEAQLDAMLKREKTSKLIINVLGLLGGIVVIFLTLAWYDWKLLVIIFIALTSNNWSQKK